MQLPKARRVRTEGFVSRLLISSWVNQALLYRRWRSAAKTDAGGVSENFLGSIRRYYTDFSRLSRKRAAEKLWVVSGAIIAVFRLGWKNGPN